MDPLELNIPSPLEHLTFKSGEDFNAELWIKRDDLIHDVISGNKYRKLKYNLSQALDQGCKGILTFGGAYSNHLVATAMLCNAVGLHAIGMVRGDAETNENATLRQCTSYGMQLVFVDRTSYRLKDSEFFLDQLTQKYPSYLILPEGGANGNGVLGCGEIVTEIEMDFDYITVDCGTGATLTGMVGSLQSHQKAIGIQVLKGSDFISNEVRKYHPEKENLYEVWTNYHFGGYAKYQPELLQFMRWFHSETGIQLDPVYTGKQFFAVFDQLKKGYFPKDSRIVLTHTGGLQGIQGFEERYGLRIY